MTCVIAADPCNDVVLVVNSHRELVEFHKGQVFKTYRMGSALAPGGWRSTFISIIIIFITILDTIIIIGFCYVGDIL